MNKIILAVCMPIVGLIAILGLYLFLKGARHVQFGVACIEWPKTSGIVVSSETASDVSTYRRSSALRAEFGSGDKLPADPDIAVLEAGNRGAALLIPEIGVVLLLMSFNVFFWRVPALHKSVGP
jgi:hypothetical protein